jgi:hypothetical protein
MTPLGNFRVQHKVMKMKSSKKYCHFYVISKSENYYIKNVSIPDV